jgi:hypothetical protein
MQPGLILTVPPVGKLVNSQETSTLAVIVHAVAFYIAAKLTVEDVFPFKYLKKLETVLTG